MLIGSDTVTKCVHRSVGCNRGTSTADIHSRTDDIVYCGGHGVLVLSKQLTKYTISHYLPCPDFVRNIAIVTQDSDLNVVYGCENGEIGLWDVKNNITLHICKQVVNALGALKVREVTYIVTCGTDSLVQVHKIHNDTVENIATISLKRSGFALSCCLTVLNGQILLALGTDESVVSLYHITDNSTDLLTTLEGHEDWVRGLDFCTTGDKTVLASGSQDNYIRLWAIYPFIESTAHFKLKQQDFLLAGARYSVKVESILLGHENWVMSVRWMSNGMLLSTSMDKTLILWHQDDTGLWSENVHVGEVGGNNLGLFGGFTTMDCTMIVSHSFQGALQCWKSVEQDDKTWTPIPMPGGHFGTVKDLSWAPSGAYLITASTDQSVRVHGEWADIGWFEVARSQVHGHDMSCLHCISDNKYVSGSEEKVLRVFQAPSTFYTNLKNISGKEVEHDNTIGGEGGEEVIGAHIPALGLSNKAINVSDMAGVKETVTYKDNPNIKDYDVPYQVSFAPVALSEPPVEEILLQNTLWPEVHKLYGHGYEVFQCSASPGGAIIATSCKAAKQEFAAIILWECDTWTKIAELVYHNLTVTRMKFSADGRYLLSVSRDRNYAVWDMSTRSLLSASSPKAHSRIIWDCAWYLDTSYSFVTVSRDKSLVIWDQDPGDTRDHVSWSRQANRTFTLAVTAVDISPRGVIVVGFEDGGMTLLQRHGNDVNILNEVSKSVCPTLTINTLQWRPNSDMFAACSDDHTVVMFQVALGKDIGKILPISEE